MLYAIERGDITAEDLENALFYFGCTREHALAPGAAGEFNELEGVADDLDESEAQAERQRVHGIVVEALKKAEQDGRVAYRESASVPNKMLVLNQLLVSNGFAAIVDTEGYYSYPYVGERIVAQRIPLDVVWR